MAVAQSRVVNKTNAEKAIDKVIRKLGRDVVRVRYNLGEDWTGDPVIFFRIVLTDAAARDDKRREVTGRIMDQVFDELQPQGNWGLHPYFRFRSKTEAARINDPDWE